MILLDGPRIPARGGKAKKLVILFHGYGSNGADLAGLAQHWAADFPDVSWVSPNAPEPVPGAPGGFQWFPISRLDPAAMESGVRMAGPTADHFIASELRRHQLEPADLALVGFSQGTMLALHLALRQPSPIAGVLGYSGALAGGEKLKDEMASRPPVMLIHGDRDDVLPVGFSWLAAQQLAAAGHGAEFHISQGLPHSIGPDGLELGARFLKAALSGRYRETLAA